MMSTHKQAIDDEKKVAAEEQIRSLRKEIDYNTRDYTIDFLIQQFRNDEFYIPDEYQRQYIWNEEDKNRFIESILLGLPIPLMFFSDTEDGRCRDNWWCPKDSGHGRVYVRRFGSRWFKEADITQRFFIRRCAGVFSKKI